MRQVPAIEHIIPEYPLDVRSRYGYTHPVHPELAALLEAQRDAYADRLRGFREHIPALARIPARETEAGEPWWVNVWFSGLDAVALYCLLVERNPRVFLEVGSGCSTRFARRAIRDHKLRTHIVSVDPHPRHDVAMVSDEVIRMPFEAVPPARLPTIGDEDIFFFDGSHYIFSNTDTVIATLESLPRSGSGTLLHYHDIFLPWDYPPEWRERHYAEQFVLAAYLLGDSLVDVVLPGMVCTRDAELHGILEPLWATLRSYDAPTNGQSLWLTRR